MNLITADELVAVTVAALKEFEAAGIDDVALASLAVSIASS